MVRFKSHFLERMNVHASEAYPDECCGVLLGNVRGGAKEIYDVLELDNSSEENRARRFFIGPEEYRQAEQRAEEKGMEVLGLYHSHPDHPARPSQFDLEHAFPWWSYVIIGVERGKPVAVSSWLLQEDRLGFKEEQLVITERLE